MGSTMEMCAFIECYESLPELWDCKNENYKNKSIRDRCYNKLLKVFRKVKSDATIEDLKKKIANMRTCYRRELKKVLNSERSGAGADLIYVSNLWYYDAFEFLRDYEMSLPPGRSSSSPDKDEGKAFINMGTTQISKKRSAAYLRTHFLKKAVEHLESSTKIARLEDEATAYANGWAHMYRQMEPTQQLFAKRAVDEILMMGRLNQLTYNTVQSIFDESFANAQSPRAATPHSNSDSADFL